MDRHFELKNVKRVYFLLHHGFSQVHLYWMIPYSSFSQVILPCWLKVVLEADGYQPYLISPEKGLRSLIKGVLELAKEPSTLCVEEVIPIQYYSALSRQYLFLLDIFSSFNCISLSPLSQLVSDWGIIVVTSSVLDNHQKGKDVENLFATFMSFSWPHATTSYPFPFPLRSFSFFAHRFQLFG